MSPPGSTTAPRLVVSSHRIEQFCWNGVTGTIAAFRPGMLVFTPLVLKPRWDIGRAGTRGNHRGAMSHGHGMADWV